MNWSQENCLIDDHHLTCERWGWGFLAASLPTFFAGDIHLCLYTPLASLHTRGAFRFCKKKEEKV